MECYDIVNSNYFAFRNRLLTPSDFKQSATSFYLTSQYKRLEEAEETLEEKAQF